MSLPVAILAGGLATRLRPVTEHDPEGRSSRSPAGRSPSTSSSCSARQGVDATSSSASGTSASMIAERARRRRALGHAVRVRLRRPDGCSARAARCGGRCRSLGDAFFVLYGDSYLECDFAADRARVSWRAAQPALMTVFRNDDRWDRSNVLFERRRASSRYDKRDRDAGHAPHRLRARRARGRGVRRMCPRDEPFDLADGVSATCSATGELAGYEVRERFYEIGSPEGLEETRAHLAARPERDRSHELRATASGRSRARSSTRSTRDAIERVADAAGRACARAAGGCSSSASAAAPATARTPSTTSARSPASRPTRRPTTSRS